MPKPLPTDPSLPPTLSEPLRALAAKGEIRRYRRNTLLIEEGDFGDTLYLILSGRLRSYSSGDKGREITYGVYGPGEYLGEMSLDGGPRSANVATAPPNHSGRSSFALARQSPTASSSNCVRYTGSPKLTVTLP